MPTQTPFGRRLRDLREEKEWSQVILAKVANMPAAMISHFETGQRHASVDSLVKLANALEVTIDYLVGRTDRRNGS